MKQSNAKTVSKETLKDRQYSQYNGWMVDKVKRCMKKYGAVNAINTDDRTVIEEYGLSRGVCINGKPLFKRMASWKEIDFAVKQVIGY